MRFQRGDLIMLYGSTYLVRRYIASSDTLEVYRISDVGVGKTLCRLHHYYVRAVATILTSILRDAPKTALDASARQNYE